MSNRYPRRSQDAASDIARKANIRGQIGRLGMVALMAAVPLLPFATGTSIAAENGTVAVLLPENINPSWQKHADIFTAELAKLDPSAKVIVFNANNDPNLQQTQFEAALTKGAEVIVITAVDSNAAASLVNKAHEQNVSVIAYDHLVNKTPHLAAYFSSDGEQQGKVTGQWTAEHTQAGARIAIVNGSPTDNNAHLYNSGYLSVLQPLFDNGERKLVGDTWIKGWDPQLTQTGFEQILTKTQNGIDAVVIPWDDGAGVVAVALKAQGLTSKVLVTGGDGTAAALNRILLGLQNMTVLRDFREGSLKSAEAAAGLLKDGKIPASALTGTFNNGAADVPAGLTAPRVIEDKDVAALIESGWAAKEDVCQGVSKGVGPC